MMSQYRLVPPFFKDELNSSFSEAWERFCLKLLKLENKTENIKKRKPPENGVDLFYKDEKIAYQCKSLEENSKFNISHAKNSLQSALKKKNEIGWEEYVLCSNGELTGEQEIALKVIYEDIDIKDREYWIGLCKKYPQVVQENFRILIDVPNKFSCQRIKENINIPDDIKEILEKGNNCIETWIYIHKTDHIFKVNVTDSMTIENLIKYLQSLFGLSSISVINTQEFKVKLGVSITDLNEPDLERVMYSEIDYKKTLAELNFQKDSLIELFINYEIGSSHQDIVFQFNEDTDFNSNFSTWKIQKCLGLQNNIKNFIERGF
ncbi:hypothetical protein [Metabacillus fastidiosus]|uniref:hypothetical protein n=1 Tax=Metabacillus fastidiosus TaxID=1458 RepID=UPI002E1DC2D9|nr:hypothetical protein [Metabacillus fastidiosus]